MVTRLLRLLGKRAIELLRAAGKETVQVDGKWVFRTIYTPEYTEVLELINKLQHLEILDANPTRRRKWAHADTYLSPGALLIVIDDEELAKNEH